MDSSPRVSRVVPRNMLIVVGCLLASCARAGEADLVLDPLPGRSWLECRSGSPAANARLDSVGGVLQHPRGHRLEVPAGALSREHTFTMVEPNSPQFMVRVVMAPPATPTDSLTLILNLDRCDDVPPAENLFLIRLDDNGQSPEEIPRTVEGSTVRARLNRLSIYALATNL